MGSEEKVILDWCDDPDQLELMANMRLDRNEEEDRDLAVSIAMNGVEQSINLRPHPMKEGVLQVYAGRRRVITVCWLKKQGIGLGSDLNSDPQTIIPWSAAPIRIPYKLKQNVTDFEAYQATLDENVVRKTVNEREIGNWLQLMLLKFGLTQKDFAVKIGKSPAWVSRHLSFFKNTREESIVFQSERQYRAFNTLPEDIQNNLREEVNKGGMIPSARGLIQRGLPPVGELLLAYDPKQVRAGVLSKDFLAQLLVEKGYEYPHALREIEQWYNVSVSSKKYVVKKNAWTQLEGYYPLNILDSVSQHHDSNNAETLRRYSRRLVGEVFDFVEQTNPGEVKKIWQKILS